MDSLKKSLMMISLILFCSANENDPKDDADTKMPDYKSLLEGLKLEKTPADIIDYKTKCQKAAKALCSNHGHGCNQIHGYAAVLLECVVYDEESNVYAKSFIHFIYNQIKATSSIEDPITFCKGFKNTSHQLTYDECESVMMQHRFLDKKKRKANTMEIMFFEWSIEKILNLENDGDDHRIEKLVLKFYIDQHIAEHDLALTIDLDVKMSNDVAKLYCGNQMCQSEIDRTFKNMSVLTLFKDMRSPNRRYISYIFKNIVISEVEFPMAQYFIVYLFKAVDISSIQMMPEDFCKNKASASKTDCEEQMKMANFGSNINEVVENIYFNWSLEDKLIPKSLYVKEYVVYMVDTYKIRTDMFEFKYNPNKFCELPKK